MSNATLKARSNATYETTRLPNGDTASETVRVTRRAQGMPTSGWWHIIDADGSRGVVHEQYLTPIA